MTNEENFEIEVNKIENPNIQKSVGLISKSGEKEENEENENSRYYINLNDSLKLYENQIDSKDNNLLGSEEIFINQKKEIEKLKKRNELFYLKKESKSNSLGNTKNNFNNIFISTNKSNEINNNNIENNEKENLPKLNINMDDNLENINNINNENIYDIQTFTLNDYKHFEYYIINSDDDNQEDNSKIVDIDNNMWKPLNQEFPLSFGKDNLNNSYNYMEINKIILRVTPEIDYDERCLELKISFILEKQSEFWIFTRSYVNKSINESCYFDEKSENIDINDNFNRYTSIIKIITEENLKRPYATFGTFYHETNENNKLYYKSFLKRQLIDYSKNNDPKLMEGDKLEFNVIINDLGEETINAKIYINNEIKSNDINGNFFLPINKKAKLLFCGKGKSVQLKNLEVKTYDKRKAGLKSNTQFEMENENEAFKNCECCSIL